MAIQPVDQDRCIGCGICITACPMDVLRLEDGKAVVKYPQECMCCAAHCHLVEGGKAKERFKGKSEKGG